MGEKSQYGNKNPNWKGGPVSLVCAFCGTPFTVVRARSNTAVYCSRICQCRAQVTAAHAAKKAKNTNPKKLEKRTRKNMPKAEGPYTRLVSSGGCGHLRKKGTKKCFSCSNKNKPYLRQRTCVTCGKQFDVKYLSQKKKTCSDDCRRIHWAKKQSGEKSHFWQGGLTSKNTKERGSIQYAIWREKVFSRDDYTCQICGNKGGRLCADHIKPWALYPLLRYEISNGQTLCRSCHSKLETTGSRLTNAMKREKKTHGGVQLRIF